MSLLVLENVALHFGARKIIDGMGLRIAETDRIGLVGPNGSGKTTILRLIAGEQQPDSGTVRGRKGMRLGYLPQDMAVRGGKALLPFVRDSVPGRAELDAEIAEVEHELQNASEIDEEQALLRAERLAALHERRDHYSTHFTEHEAMRILAGLGFADSERNRDIGELSGGWKMRAVLAGLLFQKPDLLLLDEPTNHLDMPSVAWFSGFLQRYGGAFVLVSHDREFLNEQISRVVSLEPEGVRSYTGNYERYVAQRAEEEVILVNKAKNLQREREHAQEFIDRFRAKNTKAAAVQSRIKALEKMEDVQLYEKRRALRFTFPPCARAGQEVMRAENLGKSYGDHVVLSKLDFTVQRGEKIALIGVNGAGKTTLLKTLAGEIEASTGTVKLGSNVKLGYYAQHHAETLQPQRTVYDEVASRNKDAGTTRIRTLLGAFLFSGDDAEKLVKVLSGGERARVALARLLIDPGNLLLMDEPTNHLDLDSSEALAEALTTYDGTLLFVSHNRSFIRRIATRIWNVHDGAVDVYPGTLDEYMASARDRLAEQAEDKPAKLAASVPAKLAASAPAKAAATSRDDQKERKRREAEQRQLRSQKIGPLKKKVAELEERIAALEAEQTARNTDLEKPEVYRDDKRRFEILAQMQTAADKIEELTARWAGSQEELDRLEAELARES